MTAYALCRSLPIVGVIAVGLAGRSLAQGFTFDRGGEQTAKPNPFAECLVIRQDIQLIADSLTSPTWSKRHKSTPLRQALADSMVSLRTTEDSCLKEARSKERASSDSLPRKYLQRRRLILLLLNDRPT
jgi:hypothetical protein